MMAANQLSPNQVIGTVSMAEFIVAIGATAGFLLALGGESIPLGPTVALLLGALVAAPIAAWAVSRLDHRVLGALVGGMILVYNAPNVLGIVGIDGNAVLFARVAIVIVTVLVAAYAWRAGRVGRSTSASAGASADPPRPPATIPVEPAGAHDGRSASVLDGRAPAPARTPVLVAADDEPGRSPR
jgi:uncharacterized membrane protein YfcA